MGGAQVLGMSTEAGSGLLGLSTATTVIGGVIVVCLIVGAGVYIYRRHRSGTTVVQQAQTTGPLNQQQLVQPAQFPIPLWSPISMTVAQFQDTFAFTTELSFLKSVNEKVCCPITMQVMRRPCSMACCNNLPEKEFRCAQEAVLKREIHALNRCVLCFQPATQASIQFDDNTYNTILGIRHRVLKTYRTIPADRRPQWKFLIQQYFGQGYIQSYLGNVV